jgi:hypothetical protein
MAARRRKRRKTKGFGRVDRNGLLHLPGGRKFPIKTVTRLRISAFFALFCGKSTAVLGRFNKKRGRVLKASG